IPSSSSARITRTAISPRLATRTFVNTAARISAGGRRGLAPTPGDVCVALLLVDLRRVDGAVVVGVEQPQPQARTRRHDRVVLRARPRGGGVVRRRPDWR